MATKHYELKKEVTLIGRDRQCDIILPQSYDRISRYHAQIRHEGRKHIIYDYWGRTNGVFVNGYQIRQPTILQDGTSVSIGHQLNFVYRQGVLHFGKPQARSRRVRLPSFPRMPIIISLVLVVVILYLLWSQPSTESMRNWLSSPILQGAAALVAILEFMGLGLFRANEYQRQSQPPAQQTGRPVATQSKWPWAQGGQPGITRSFRAAAGLDIRFLLIEVTLIIVIGWIIYSIPWALLFFAARLPGLPPQTVISFLFLVLGSLPAIGSAFAKSPKVGGFIGGAVPLSLVTLFLSSYGSLSMDLGAGRGFNPFSLFILAFLIGGVWGSVVGLTTVDVVERIIFYAKRRRWL